MNAAADTPGAVIRFEPDRVYVMRWLGDSGDTAQSSRYTVVARTAKTVTVASDSDPTPRRHRIHIRDGVERIDPHGRYSLSPVLSADRDTGRYFPPTTAPADAVCSCGHRFDQHNHDGRRRTPLEGCSECLCIDYEAVQS